MLIKEWLSAMLVGMNMSSSIVRHKSKMERNYPSFCSKFYLEPCVVQSLSCVWLFVTSLEPWDCRIVRVLEITLSQLPIYNAQGDAFREVARLSQLSSRNEKRAQLFFCSVEKSHLFSLLVWTKELQAESVLIAYYPGKFSSPPSPPLTFQI